ncbi:hypothetical protein DFJ73DRAFT_192192 [Zopfochytrium polystomum]|nr:hypothetical protein DFJ73DRAFT_192192 [Zopfochytrium polystomum]
MVQRGTVERRSSRAATWRGGCGDGASRRDHRLGKGGKSSGWKSMIETTMRRGGSAQDQARGGNVWVGGVGCVDELPVIVVVVVAAVMSVEAELMHAVAYSKEVGHLQQRGRMRGCPTRCSGSSCPSTAWRHLLVLRRSFFLVATLHCSVLVVEMTQTAESNRPRTVTNVAWGPADSGC